MKISGGLGGAIYLIRAAQHCASTNRYRDFLGDNRRVKDSVFGVAHHELKRVPPRRQIELRLGLPCPEMQMSPVRRDGFARPHRLVDIDQQMMMSGIGHMGARRSN